MNPIVKNMLGKLIFYVKKEFDGLGLARFS